MNRLKKYIREKGEIIGEGASRRAYLIGDKVFKIEHDTLYRYIDGKSKQISQSAEEIKFLQTAKESFGELDIFIDIQPITDKIVVAPKIDHIANRTNEFYAYCDRNEINTNFKSYVKFCKEYYDDFKHKNIESEIEKLDMFGLGDFHDNLSNVGYHQGYIKIIDYGYGC